MKEDRDVKLKKPGSKIIHKELSFVLQGIVYQIRNDYGQGHKEIIYKNLLFEALRTKNLRVEKERRIPVYSHTSRKQMGVYQPDLVLENKIIVELKSSLWTVDANRSQLIFYLKNSPFELGYLINFGSPRLYMKRFVFANDRKNFRVNS